jgi:hypothetical protein
MKNGKRLNNFSQQKKEASLSAGLFYFPTIRMASPTRIRALLDNLNEILTGAARRTSSSTVSGHTTHLPSVIDP